MRNAVWLFSMILCAALSASPAFAQTYTSRETVTSDTTKWNAVIYQNISTTGRLYLGGAIHVNAGKNYTANKAFSAINNSVATSGGALAVAAGASFTAKGANASDDIIFRGNKATSSLSGSTIDYGFGGAIYNLGTVKMGNLSTIDIFIENNQASNRGGGIYNAATGIFSLNSRTKIYNNTAKEGGGLYNTGNFSQGENEATSGYAVSFNGNKATSGNGGGIYNSGAVNLWTSYINGMETFIKNTATVYGGAVYNAASGQMNIQKGSSVIFKQNSATNGGAYYGGLKSALNFLGGKTVFDSNTASVSGNGGAMYTANGSSVYSSGSDDGVRFVNNEAGNGGAIYNEQGAGHLYNSGLTFENNKAAVDGGALYNAGNFSLTSSATTLFNGNKTTSPSRVSCGGAVYNAGNFTSTQSVTFTDNSALQGGAVYNAGTMTFKGSSKAVFQQNTASMDGGAVMNRGTMTFAAADFIGNKADVGAAVYNGGKLSFTGKAYFDGNTAGAGVLVNDDAGEITFADAEFINNASSDGTVGAGAIFNEGTINFTGASYKFENNTVDGVSNDIANYGTIFIGAQGGTDFKISNVAGSGATQIAGVVTLNAAKAGGTIFWHNTINIGSAGSVSLTIADNIEFNGVHNPSTLGIGGDGGAIFNAAELTANGTGVFIKNKAGQHGGAMSTTGSKTVWNGHLTFKENEAAVDGGALHNRFGGTTTLTGGADFIGNKATGRSGGGIYNNVGGTVNLFGGTYTFKDNVDSSGLNDIYNGSDLNVGIAGKTTSLNISFVSGDGSTTFDGDVALNAVKDNKIFWHNNITLASGATLNIGTGVLNVGANNFDSSAGTLKLSISGLTAGSSDYAGGQFVSGGGTVSIGKLFVTVDPSLSFVGKTGELTLLDGYTGDFTADMPGISDGYTISYTENGKFIIERSQAPQPPDNPDNPKPSPTPQAALTAVEVSRANVRAVLSALTARASSGFTAGGYKGRSAGADSQKYGVWAQGLYNNLHYKGVLNANSAGFVTGGDFEASANAVLGVGYAYTASSADATGASTDIDMHNVFAYARYNPSAVFADFSAGYGFGKAKIKDGPQYDMRYAHAAADAGVNLASRFGTLTPVVSARYTFTKQDEYTVGGVRYKAEDSDLLTGVAGVRWSKDYTANGKSFKPYVFAAATYDFISDDVKTTRISGGAVLLSNGGRTKRLGAEVAAGVRAVLSNNWAVALDYKGNFTSGYQSNTGLFSVEFKF